MANPYQSANPWGGAADWLRGLAESGSRKASRFGTRSYPGMQAPIQDEPDFGEPTPLLDPERQGLREFAFGLGPSEAMAPGEGVRIPDSGTTVPRTVPQGGDDDPVGVDQSSGGGRVDVTIDGKTYSYGGGQRGGANGPAPVLDARPDVDGDSHSGAKSGGFGGELARMGRGPLDIASTGGAGELGKDGTSGMVGLSEDSTTPMALQLRDEALQRAMRESLERKLVADPLYRERELAKIDQSKQEALYSAQGKSATAAYERARKMQASQRVDQQAQEYARALEEKYATDPAALNRAMTQLQQDVMSRKQAIESDYGST